ncbi:MAG: VanZ family protein [Bryobacteraceae bacterium]
MGRILVIVVALIVYGSLYPWRFESRHYVQGPLWMLLHSWPRGLNRYVIWDGAVNLVLYFPFGLFALLTAGKRLSNFARVCAVCLMALLLSASIEMVQLYDAARECSLLDVTSNFAGAAVGALVGLLYERSFLRAGLGGKADSVLRPSQSLLLLLCWLGYQTFPLFPSFGRTHLLHQLSALGPLPAISLVQTLLVFAEWLAVGCLLDEVLHHGAGKALGFLLLVPFGHLIIAARSLTWAEAAGTLAAGAAWFLLPRASVRKVAPFVLAVALLAGELAPFHIGQTAAFNWIPFRGLIQSSWEKGLVVLFRKAFWYGAFVWLWSKRGNGIARSAAWTAFALIVLEAVQTRLPGRVPEITDAMLCILMAVLLHLLDSHANRVLATQARF